MNIDNYFKTHLTNLFAQERLLNWLWILRIILFKLCYDFKLKLLYAPVYTVRLLNVWFIWNANVKIFSYVYNEHKIVIFISKENLQKVYNIFTSREEKIMHIEHLLWIFNFNGIAHKHSRFMINFNTIITFYWFIYFKRMKVILNLILISYTAETNAVL